MGSQEPLSFWEEKNENNHSKAFHSFIVSFAYVLSDIGLSEPLSVCEEEMRALIILSTILPTNGYRFIEVPIHLGGKMKSTTKYITLCLAAFFIFFNTGSVFGANVNVKLVEKIKFFSESKSPQKPWAFCVTGDGLFIIPDYQAGDIKIYERNGAFLYLIETIGRKGFGKDEFGEPTLCFYNKTENKLGIFDFGQRKIFIYDRMERLDFRRIKSVYCQRLGYDIQLIGNRLLISGYKVDQNTGPYSLYYINLSNDQESFLLPAHHKYGLKSSKEYEYQVHGKPNIRAVGRKGWFDVDEKGEYVYFVWEGHLKIIKLNMKSGELSSFGKESSHYIKPKGEKLLESRRSRDLKKILAERAKMSYVTDIFTTIKHVLVIYKGPIKEGMGSNFRLQFYTLKGAFVEEVPIPGQPDYKMCLDKEKKILYSLKSSGENSRYFILKYKISE